MKPLTKQCLSNKKLTRLYIPERESTELIFRTPLPKVARSIFYPYWCVVINLVFGLIGLSLLLVILPFLALLIYLDSSGPIFYVQERLGYRGSVFRMYKFRTMHAALYNTSFIRTEKLDSRITRTGHFLRTTHLDELPQVINILCGDMNVIGPRPEQPEIAAQLGDVIPLYQARLEVKPGLTGWAQVRYQYTNSLQGDMVKLKHDLYYISNRSIQLDASILLKTFVEVFFLRGR